MVELLEKGMGLHKLLGLVALEVEIYRKHLFSRILGFVGYHVISVETEMYIVYLLGE